MVCFASSPLKWLTTFMGSAVTSLGRNRLGAVGAVVWAHRGQTITPREPERLGDPAAESEQNDREPDQGEQQALLHSRAPTAGKWWRSRQALPRRAD